MVEYTSKSIASDEALGLDGGYLEMIPIANCKMHTN